jgi:hypothetical protein
VDVRYDVTLDGQVVGTTLLPAHAEGCVVARLNPLPAFRAVRDARRQLRDIHRATAAGRELTEAEMTGEERALGALSQLELRLVDPRGVAVPNASVALLPGEPPRVRVRFWRPADALDDRDPAG